MTNPAPTTSEIIASANAAASLLVERLGFASASVETIKLDKLTGEPSLQLWLHDSIPGVENCYKTLTYPFSTSAAALGTKRQRELRNLAEKLTSLRAATGEIEDLQVQAFVAELTRPLDELSRLISYQRAA